MKMSLVSMFFLNANTLSFTLRTAKMLSRIASPKLFHLMLSVV